MIIADMSGFLTLSVTFMSKQQDSVKHC